MKGNITKRGARSWRLKFDTGIDPTTGKRKTAWITVRGTYKQAQQELSRRLAAFHDGTHVEPNKTTLKEWLDRWLANQHGLCAKTRERYEQLIEHQIVPHLGEHPIQKLRAAHISSWHTTLLSEGGHGGKPLAPRTVGHAHRVLRKALGDAVRLEEVARNVVTVVPAPKVAAKEVEILSEDDISTVLGALRDTSCQLPWMYPLVALALASGMRRGELLALRWPDIDLDGGKLRVERTLEETSKALTFKPPKTAKSRRTVTLPDSTIRVLRDHRAQQLRDRMQRGAGAAPKDALLFPCPASDEPVSPNKVTREWRRLVANLGLPPVSLHALRHTHASALIAAGVDVVTVSRRLGHSNPSITLNVYSHLFAPDDKAASAIEAALGHLG